MAQFEGADVRSDSNSSINGEKRHKNKKSKSDKHPRPDDDATNAENHIHVARRSSLSKPCRDERDEPKLKRRKKDHAKDGPKRDGRISSTRSSPVIDFDGLSRPSLGTRERLEEEGTDKEKDRLDRMKGAVRTLLECVGEDPDREGLLATPERYAKAMLFFTQGYQQNVMDLVNGAIFEENHNELVIVKDIDVHSVCEHHLVPFTGKMHIGYIPQNTVIGISKLPRIAEMFSRRLQIQERLTKEVANAIYEVLQPQGVAVVMESSHLCMVMRGVQKTSSTTITSCVLGCFERREKTRNEFLSLIGVNRR
jgi:GTP cyclohydrolase I